jgi:hypothetical protein
MVREEWQGLQALRRFSQRLSQASPLMWSTSVAATELQNSHRGSANSFSARILSQRAVL